MSPAQIAREALLLRDRDDPEAAAGLLAKATRRWPDEPLLWQCLGLVERARLESASAMAALQKAARLAPGDGRIALALAYVTMEAGLPAVDLFDRTLRLLPGDGAVLIGRAAAQLAQGQGLTAITDLAAACRANPFWLDGHGALADLRWVMGHEDEFVASYAAALAQHPQALPLWLAMLDRYQRVGRYDWAQRGLDAARRLLGERDEWLPMRAICASELGQHAQADRLFAQLLSNPLLAGDPALASRHMRHLLRCGRPEAALERGLPLTTSPGAGEIWPYVATAWRLLGDPRWHWLEGDSRLVRRIRLYTPDELAPLAACLRGLHGLVHEPAGQSVRGGSQTDGPLFARIEPEIRALRQRIERVLAEHLRGLGEAEADHPTLGRRRPVKVRFAGSWSVRLRGAGHHANHVHPQGWLSAALHVAVPPLAERGPAPAGHLQLGLPPAELGLALEPVQVIPPEPGWLTLFPSTMWHGTVPIAGGERLSVAFDIRPLAQDAAS